jgi:hypothetical protein
VTTRTVSTAQTFVVSNEPTQDWFYRLMQSALEFWDDPREDVYSDDTPAG